MLDWAGAEATFECLNENIDWFFKKGN
jgi:hypothetical protein